MPVKTANIKCNDFVFDCRVCGTTSDALVIFLHGFPETSYMWKNLLPEISAIGFYCVAPNLRGYSNGARPRGKKHYTLDKLSQDVLSIAKALGKSKFHLVGHDWGAAIGWYLASMHPNMILSWSALSIPHLEAFGQAIRNDADQKKKSQYIKNFQTPFLPEHTIKKNDFKLFRKVWRESSDNEVEDYLNVFRQKYAVTAALNYYRANYKAFLKDSIGNIVVPTLFIWGEKDMAIGSVSVKNSHRYMKSYYKFVKLDTGHWLVQTKLKEIKKEISEHLLKFK